MNRAELKQHFKAYCLTRWPENTAKEAAKEYEVTRSMIYAIWSDKRIGVIPNGRMLGDMLVAKDPENWVRLSSEF